MWITNVSICDIINVSCAEGRDERGLARMRRVIVERDASPFETREIPTLGLKQGHLGEAVFEGTRVPADNALGSSGDVARVLTLTSIGKHQLVQKNLADIETSIVSARLLCYYALDCIDRGMRTNGISAMAKRYATTACEQAVSLALHVHGAIGISTELGLEQLYRDIRMLPIPDGTNDILTLIQGREITDLEAFRH